MAVNSNYLVQREEVISIMKLAFPDLLVKVTESMSDKNRNTFWVKVFCVPEDFHDVIENFIIEINAHVDSCLLPNVFKDRGWGHNGNPGHDSFV